MTAVAVAVFAQIALVTDRQTDRRTFYHYNIRTLLCIAAMFAKHSDAMTVATVNAAYQPAALGSQ